MTRPTAAPASIPLPTWDNGQQRLSAAIALFRSEASASGYVVEEVRLRLPVPDVDVMPRVVIAQQSGANNNNNKNNNSNSNAPNSTNNTSTSPAYPPPKYHRTLARSDIPGERQKVQIGMPPKKMPRSPSFGLRSQPMPPSNEHKIVGPLPKSNGAGFKRTVSGSVIVRQQDFPLRRNVPTKDPNNNNNNNNNVDKSDDKTSNKDIRLSSPLKTGEENNNSPKLTSTIEEVKEKETGNIHDYPEEDRDDDENDSPTKDGKFWKTVIGAERRATILRAAEHMQKLRNDSVDDRPVDNVHLEERETSIQSEDSNSENMSPLKNILVRRKDEDDEGHSTSQKRSVQDADSNRGNEEKTIKYNGHNIPESHVQLLLSSVATISARDRSESDRDSSRSSEESRDKPEHKSSTAVASSSTIKSPQNEDVILPRPSRPTQRPSKPSGRGRRDSAERGRTSSALRPFKCHKCPSSFDRDGHLKVHILAVHEKKRPFVCQVCDASFGHSSSLLRHVRTVHQASPAVGSGRVGHMMKNAANAAAASGTERAARRSVEEGWEEVQDAGEKHFRCSACGLGFSRVALLNRHVANKHPIDQPLSLSEDADVDEKESP